ncbi:MAG: methylmalonyl-CoA mutase, partial [Chitinophagia bacterium]|nr:methylmalonyl-CoA mutase [Chitinophagia bacterium]
NSWGELKDIRTISRSITLAEARLVQVEKNTKSNIPVLGITGTGGAGKSTITDEIVRRFLEKYSDKTIAVISVDPSKKKTGGALLGDRIRMNSIHSPRVYMRSMATRTSEKTISATAQQAINICKEHGFDLIILESAGAGQSDASIVEHCDMSLYVMTPEYGAASQLEKINMLDFADAIALNKFDKPGALDALHDIKKQYKRNHGLWEVKNEDLPIFGTISSQFNDEGINKLFGLLMNKIFNTEDVLISDNSFSDKNSIIPNSRIRYLSEITEEIRKYNRLVNEQSILASELYKLYGTLSMINDPHAQNQIKEIITQKENHQIPLCKKLIDEWDETKLRYQKDEFEYQVRDKTVKRSLKFISLSGTSIPRIAVPAFKDWGDILKWRLQENFPGKFPYTASVFPLRNAAEDPTRMFAGEGGPERTNRRFHYLSSGQPFIRLSTAFDSVTLYGNDPDHRPDIYGKIGNSGVSIATVDDAKKLYSGFDLSDSKTSVSMTINGPAPMMLAFFLHAAIDQACEKYIEEHGLWDKVINILKEKQKI